MKMPALILASVVAILPLTSARSEEKAEDSAKKIKELQKERLTTLKDLVEIVTKLYQNGRTEFVEVVEARQLLFKAELDAAEKESDRIALYKKNVEVWKEYEEFTLARKQAARGNHIDVLKAKAMRLEAEIGLEQAKMKEAKERK